jgi:hypothetical protein
VSSGAWSAACLPRARESCVRCHRATPSTNAGGTPQLGNGVRARELALLASQGRRCPRGACRCQGRSRPPVWWRVVPATRCPSWCAPGFGTTPQRAGTLRPWHPWAPRRGSHRASAHDPGEPSQGARRPGRCGPEQEVVAIVVTPVGCCTSSEDHTVANAAGAPPRGPGRLGSRWRFVDTTCHCPTRQLVSRNGRSGSRPARAEDRDRAGTHGGLRLSAKPQPLAALSLPRARTVRAAR